MVESTATQSAEFVVVKARCYAFDDSRIVDLAKTPYAIQCSCCVFHDSVCQKFRKSDDCANINTSFFQARRSNNPGYSI